MLKGNLARRGWLWVLPWVIVCGTEAAELEVAIVCADFKPGAASRIEGGICPGIQVYVGCVLGNRIGECVDANVGGPIDIEGGKSDWKTAGVRGKLDRDGIAWLGLSIGANLCRAKRVGGCNLRHLAEAVTWQLP